MFVRCRCEVDPGPRGARRAKSTPVVPRGYPAVRLLTSILLSGVAVGCGESEGRPPSTLYVTVTDQTGAPGPCKLTFDVLTEPLEEWGTGEIGAWTDEGAVAVGRTVVAQRCDGTAVTLPSGRYRVTASRGVLFEAAVAEVEVPATEELALRLTPVSAPPVTCGDLHVHSAPSFDSDVPIDQRLISAAAEGLDVIVPADHDTIGAWESHVMALGMDSVEVAIGVEVTPDQWAPPMAVGHFNLYPVDEDFDVTLPTTAATPRDLVDLLRGLRDETTILQLNHPRFNEWIGYAWAIDFDPAMASTMLLEAFPFDAIEVYNGHELDKESPGDVTDVLVDWFVLLNHGWRGAATGSSDTHRLTRSPVGLPRTCIAGADLTTEAFLEGVRQRRAVVTNGPSLTVEVGGGGPGETVLGGGAVTARAMTAWPEWAAADQLEVWVNGSRTFDAPLAPGGSDTTEIDLEIDQDAWVVVIVTGSTPLGVPGGQPAKEMLPLAFTNPVFIDVGGDGWIPPVLE